MSTHQTLVYICETHPLIGAVIAGTTTICTFLCNLFNVSNLMYELYQMRIPQIITDIMQNTAYAFSISVAIVTLYGVIKKKRKEKKDSKTEE